MLLNIWNRVVQNWETSSVGIIAAAIVIASWFGLETSTKEVAIVVCGIQTVVLLFAKD